MNSFTELPHFALKYCERCAGLWLRPQGSTTAYCPACERFMAELPARKLRKPPSRATVACTKLPVATVNRPPQATTAECEL